MGREELRDAAILLAGVLVLVAAMTGLWMWDFAGECRDTGGTFHMDGATVWCRS